MDYSSTIMVGNVYSTENNNNNFVGENKKIYVIFYNNVHLWKQKYPHYLDNKYIGFCC